MSRKKVTVNIFGLKYHYFNNVLHREGGPAIEGIVRGGYADRWYWEGKYFSSYGYRSMILYG